MQVVKNNRRLKMRKDAIKMHCNENQELDIFTSKYPIDRLKKLFVRLIILEGHSFPKYAKGHPQTYADIGVITSHLSEPSGFSRTWPVSKCVFNYLIVLYNFDTRIDKACISIILVEINM